MNSINLTFLVIIIIITTLLVTFVGAQNWLLPYLVPANYSPQVIPPPTDSDGQLDVRIQFKMNKFQVTEAKMVIL